MRIVCQTEGKVTTEILDALLVICTRVTTLHSCHMKNTSVFSQSDAHNFFRYVISAQIGLVITYHVREFCYTFDFQISYVHCASTLDFDIVKR